MKKLWVLLMTTTLVLGLCGIAAAYDPTEVEKPGQGIETYAPIAAKATYNEVEPNNDCATANGPIVAGDVWNAMIDVAGDGDWYRVEVPACVDAIFETVPQAGQLNMDTYLELYQDPNCTTRIAYDDDSGVAAFSRLVRKLQPGVYYVKIRAYGATTVGTYYALTYTTTECPPPPPNDTCENAIDLQAQGLIEWDVNTCSGTNDYTPIASGTGGCTGYAANGLDVVYKITIGDGETFSATQSVTGTTPDMSLYLVTDCADIAGTCVDGSDNCCGGAAETVEWTNTTGVPVTLFLIVDAYSSGGCANYHIIVNAPVATESQSWGAAKSLYR